jgi:hypothetical protein
MAYSPYIPVHLVHRTVAVYGCDVLLILCTVDVGIEWLYDFLVAVSPPHRKLAVLLVHTIP